MKSLEEREAEIDANIREDEQLEAFNQWIHDNIQGMNPVDDYDQIAERAEMILDTFNANVADRLNDLLSEIGYY